MILTPSDFDARPYKVPNQAESGDFGSFIDAQERELARGLLGVELAELFFQAVETSGAVEQRFEDLRDGGTYTYQGKTYLYAGWVDLIRPAVYSLWQPQGTWKFTNIGWVENNAPQQSKLIEDQYPFHVVYWNEFCRKVGVSPSQKYLYVNSFYGWMTANQEDFPEWVFTAPEFKNRLDI